MKFHQTARKSQKIDKFFFITLLLIIVLGVVMFVSASLGLLVKSPKAFYSVLFNQLVLGLGLGLVGMYFSYKINYKFWREYSLYILIGAILLTAAVFIPGLKDSMYGAVHSIRSALWKKSSLELPVFAGKTLAFPVLPKGVYAGALEGVLPGKTIPLTLISFGEEDKIAVLLGVEGWTPVMVQPQKLLTEDGESLVRTMRVASNGIFLEMTGEIVGGKIVGYFSNLVNGAQGQWSVEPAV